MATLQIPDVLLHQLQAAADRQHRTIDEQAVITIQQGLQATNQDFWREFPPPERPLRPVGMEKISAIIRAGRDAPP